MITHRLLQAHGQGASGLLMLREDKTAGEVVVIKPQCTICLLQKHTSIAQAHSQGASGLLTLREDKASGEVVVTGIDRRHPLYRHHRKWSDEEAAGAAAAAEEAAGGSAGGLPGDEVAGW